MVSNSIVAVVCCAGVTTNIQNFKMSLYLQLSCTYSGHWILPCALVLSLLVSLAIWLSCDLADSLCLAGLSITVCQVLLGLTLLAYLNVLSDLLTQRIRQLMTADSEVRDRVRALLAWRPSNSVTPLEEISTTGNNTTADTETNNSVLKDHIRWFIIFLTDRD